MDKVKSKKKKEVKNNLENSLKQMIEENDRKRKRIDYLWSVVRDQYTATKVYKRMNALQRDRAATF